MSNSNGNKSHLLVITEDPKTCDFFAAQFKTKYSVKCVSHLKESFEIFKNESIDLIVSESKMSPLGAFEIWDSLKKNASHIPVIFIAEPGEIEAILKFLQMGAADFISKPLSAPEVAARIEKALSTAHRFKKLGDQLHAEKMHSIGRLVSGMAHEINNPLTAVLGYTQLLMDTGGQDLERQLSVIKDQAQRCGRIIQDLMLFARHRKPILSELDLGALIESVIQSAKAEIEIRKIQCQFQTSESGMKIMGDATILKKVFVNLLSNACHALEEKETEKKIRISLKSVGDQVQVDIQDNGHGIPAENIKKIFDPFFTTREVGKGTGLGLSLCYSLISEHGGTIQVKSEEGQGALFTLLLPKGLKAKDNGKNIDTESLDAVYGQAKKVLMIEDEHFIAEFVSKVLKDRGFEMTVVHDGELGYRELKNHDYDVVLCDYRVPKMNGIQIFDRIMKEKGGLRDKFALVTASISFLEGPDEQSLKEKGVLLLSKPFTAEDLLKTVHACLSKVTHP